MLGDLISVLADVDKDSSGLDETVNSRSVQLSGVTAGNTLLATLILSGSVITEVPEGWERIARFAGESTTELYLRRTDGTETSVDFTWSTNTFFRTVVTLHEGLLSVSDVSVNSDHVSRDDSAENLNRIDSISSIPVILDEGDGYAFVAAGAQWGHLTENPSPTNDFTVLSAKAHTGGLARPAVVLVGKSLSGTASESTMLGPATNVLWLGAIAVMFNQFVAPPSITVDSESKTWGETITVTPSSFDSEITDFALVSGEANEAVMPLSFTGNGPYAVSLPDYAALIAAQGEDMDGVAFKELFTLQAFNTDELAELDIQIEPQPGWQVFEYGNVAADTVNQLGFLHTAWDLSTGPIENIDQVYLPDYVTMTSEDGQFTTDDYFDFAFYDASAGVVRFGAWLEDVPPVISLQGETDVIIRVGETYQEQGFTVSDNESSLTPDDVDVQFNFDSSSPGVGSIDYRAEDQAGNSVTAMRRVTIVTDVSVNPVLEIPIRLDGSPAPQGTLISAVVNRDDQQVVARAEYPVNENNAIVIDHPALILGTAYDIVTRHPDIRSTGIELRNEETVNAV